MDQRSPGLQARVEEHSMGTKLGGMQHWGEQVMGV